METQRILKPTGVMILSDYREKEVTESLRGIGANVREASLDVGDFVVSDRTVIERKDYSDFISSVIDGRIFEQAKDLNSFEKPIVIVEGYSTRRVNENMIKAALASLIIDFGISVISTHNPHDTAKTIYWIAKKEQEEYKKGIAVKVGKKPKSVQEQREFILCGLPGVSTKTAKKILDEFGSVKNFFRADEKEMERVLGKKAKNIWKIVNA
jgi:Fanconi anemia group M protein